MAESKETQEKRPTREAPKQPAETWTPKTELGRLVQAGKVTHIDQAVDSGAKIQEPEIVDVLLPNLKTDLLLIGQSKGKFGGGQRRVFKQTQKKTKEGNKPKFATYAVVGNEDGYVGVGYGKAKETVPAREKALRNAKLNLIKIRRGSGSWQTVSASSNSIPFAVSAKVGSVELTLIPAPKGTGLVVDKECQKILALAGIKDCWSKTSGATKTKTNVIAACFEALKKLMETKVNPKYIEPLGIVEGGVAVAVEEKNE